MSKNLSLIGEVPFITGIGSKIGSSPVGYCRPVDDNGPRVVEVVIPWTQAPYNASLSKPNVSVNINLANQTVALPLDKIRSIKVDNTFCDATVYVQFSDTTDTIVIPPNSVVIAPIASNTQEAFVYGTNFFTGRSPQTTIVFCNYAQPAVFIKGDVGTELNVAMTDTAVSLVAQNTYNFASNFGTPYPTRLCVVAVETRNAAGNLGDPTSVTAHGVALTKIGSASTLITFDGNTSHNLSLWYGIVPSNVSQITTIVLPVVEDYCVAGFWVVRNYTSIVPFSSSGDSTPNSWEDVFASPEVVPGSVCIYAGLQIKVAGAQPSMFEPPEIFGDATFRAYQLMNGITTPSPAVVFADLQNIQKAGLQSFSMIGSLAVGASWA